MHLSTKNQVIAGIFILVAAIVTVTFNQQEPKQSIRQTAAGGNIDQALTTGDHSPITKVKIENFVRGNSQFSQAVDKIEKLKELANPYNDGGSFKSYLNLLSMKSQELDQEVYNVLLETITKVESWYTPHPLQMNIHTIYPNYICRAGTSNRGLGFEPQTEFDAHNVISHLSYQHWQERAKAAAMLMDIKNAKNKDLTVEEKESLFKKLVARMDPETEFSLYAAKMAFETYKELANFNPAPVGVLEFNKAIEDWGKRKLDILEITF